MALGNMQHDGTGFEQDEIAFLIGRDLPEGMKRDVRRLLLSTEGNEANVIGLSHFLKRPADTHVARQSTATIRRAFEGCDRG
jgi:hypothetical protein